MTILEPEQFERLTPEDQATYLELISAELETWALNPRQTEAEQLSHKVDELLYGGAAGGGKSEWLLWHVLHLSLEHPGHKSLVLRANFPELQRTLIRNSIARFATLPVKQRPTWRAAAKEWKFPNGSLIDFGHCETDDDVRKYLSAEYECIAFDELTEFTDYQYSMLRTRLRTTQTQRDRGIRPHVIACSNPGQRGHAWVKETFVDPHPNGYGHHTLTTETAGITATRTIGYCRATVHDNPHIDPGYINNLATGPEHLRRLYLEGDWNSFEGRYFPDYKPTIQTPTGEQPWHYHPQPFHPPEHWPRWRGIDYGYVAPYCCLWTTRDPHTGITHIYREDYTTGCTAEEQTRRINQQTRHPNGTPEHIMWTSLDPSCWRREGTGTNIATTYMQHGIPVRKADNRRTDGWNTLHEHLQTTIQTQHGPQPALQLHNTPNLHTELQNAQHAPNTPEDLNTHQPDHALDALRYTLMHHPPPTTQPPKTPTWAQTHYQTQTTTQPPTYPTH